MGYTDIYELEEIGYGTSGWNGILTTDLQILDDVIMTRVSGTFGEAVSQYDTVWVQSDGSYYKAIASGTTYPVIGVMHEAAVSGATDKRLYVNGQVTNTSWTWTIGSPVYTSTVTAGALTQTWSDALQHQVGVATKADTIHLNLPSGGHLQNVVEDTSPQLGGDLEGNGNNITLGSTEAFYLGGTTTSGSWRMIRSGDNLQFQWYDGASWNNGNITSSGVERT